MGQPWRVFVVLVFLFSLISWTGVQAQTTGRLVLNTDLELLSIGEITGGGRLKWTLVGEQAQVLRAKVLAMFDERGSISRGFAFQFQPTGTTGATLNNSQIESAEAGTYLNYLENELEGILRNYQGVEFRFVQVKAADRAERDLPAERSSQGLVGTTAASTSNIEISFLFEVLTSRTPERRFAQANRAFADALHKVFGFDTGAESLTVAGCPPSCYPFPASVPLEVPATARTRGGWRVVPWSPHLAGGPFLWHGNASVAGPWNITAGAYEPGWSNATHYSSDGVVVSPLDLRFAMTANLSFEHTGGTGIEAAQDALFVQLSTDDGATWRSLTAANDGDGNPAVDRLDLNILGTSIYDLANWTGQRVLLRLNFTTDGEGTADGPGYFVRNMRINAPSVFEGTIDMQHVDYVVGFLSFSHLDSPRVKPHIIRTPVGEVMYYYGTYEADDVPTDTARYATFDAIENPQILFVILVVCAWLLGLFQDKAWERYRQMHPVALRPSAVKTKWLHWTGRILILVLVLFYFFPTALGSDLIVGGGAFWVMALGVTVGLATFTTFWYRRKESMLPAEMKLAPGERLASELPPPPPPAGEVEPARAICAHCDMDIEDPADVYVCACGQKYHVAHAAERGTCVNCGRELAPPPPPERRMVTVQCPTCGEINVLEEGTDVSRAKCTACGVILKDVARAYNYLLIADEPHVAYEWFNSVVRKGVPGLCMSTTFPEKVRREYGLPDVELYWVSDTNPGPRTLDPKRLDFEIMRALSNFVKNNKGGAIVLDGIEYLVVENSFDRVLKFVKKVNDLASVHDVTMFVPVTSTGLGPEEMTLLRKEFDKVETVAKK